jgi:divalent metal cation (Fe/Co/Zn/Cd) transporter
METTIMSRTHPLIHRGLLLEYASLAWMMIEAIVAIGAGFFAGSLALLAFGGDSVIELISSFTVAGHLKRIESGSRFDCERDKGVEKVATFLLFALIPVIGFGAVYSYESRILAEASPLGIAVAVGAVSIMPLLWHEKRRIGLLTNCLPLEIDAIESATCFLMSVALLTSLLVNYLWKVPWIDYVGTAIILAFVAREGFKSLSEVRKPIALT